LRRKRKARRKTKYPEKITRRRTEDVEESPARFLALPACGRQARNDDVVEVWIGKKEQRDKPAATFSATWGDLAVLRG